MEPKANCNFLLDSGDGFGSNSTPSLQLKVIGIGVIFFVSAVGVSLPLVGKGYRFLNMEGNLFFVLKAFAAGVILSTGFVHILPDGLEAFEKPCVPKFWTAFPFGGFIAMMSALMTLLVDNFCTDYYESLHTQNTHEGQNENQPLITSLRTAGKLEHQAFRENSLLRLGSRGKDFTSGKHMVPYVETSQRGQNRELPSEFQLSQVENQLSHLEKTRIRNVVILQVLEVAVISHSFIIGLSLGVSGTARTVRPLVAALSFHQFFEGFALGGSICQVGFKCSSALFRAALFAVTTPLGIVVGIIISSSYDANSAGASIVEGTFDSASAGILIYMALVALISPDFCSDRIKGDSLLRRYAYFALFIGTFIMSALALWA